MHRAESVVSPSAGLLFCLRTSNLLTAASASAPLNTPVMCTMQADMTQVITMEETMGTAMARMVMGACQGSCMLLIALQSSDVSIATMCKLTVSNKDTCICSSGDLRLQE